MDGLQNLRFALDIIGTGAGIVTVFYIAYSIYNSAKVSLFKHRYDVYKSTMDYIEYITGKGHSPNYSIIRNASAELKEQSYKTFISYVDAMNKSKFLFGDEIYEILKEIYDKSMELDYARDSDIDGSAKKAHDLMIELTSDEFRAYITAAFSRYLKFHD